MERRLTLAIAAVHLFLIFLWLAIPVLNTRHIYGFPNVSNPNIPGPLVDTRFGIVWWLVWLIGLQAVLPFLVVTGMIYPKVARLIRGASIVLFVLYAVLVIAWVIISLGYCNASVTSGNMVCNDVLYCCVYNCENCPVGGCTPSVTARELQSSTEWGWHGFMLFFGGVVMSLVYMYLPDIFDFLRANE